MADFFQGLHEQERVLTNFKLDRSMQGLFDMYNPQNMIIPLDLSKIILKDYSAELNILDSPNQVYGKALHNDGVIRFKNGNHYEGNFFNGMMNGKVLTPYCAY